MTESRPRWEIILTRQAEKSLYRLSKLLLQHLDQIILALAETPYPPASQQLAGYDNLYRLPVAEWRITYAVEAARLVVLILEIAPREQPERYRLEEESDEDFSPVESQPQGQPVVSTIIELRRQYLSEFRMAEDDFFYRGPSLLKRLRKTKIRLLIVDALAETRENLRKSLFAEPDIEVVGTATTGEEAIQMAVELQPDVVLMDILLPGLNGITAMEAIFHQVPSAQIIVMSVQSDAETFRQAMLAGAKEFLIKPFSGQELMTSIRRVYQTGMLARRPAVPENTSTGDAFEDLKVRIQNRLIAELDPTLDISRPNELGRSIVQNRFERILAQENIILSRSERERLFESIVTELLETELDEPQKRTLVQWFQFFKLGNKVEISLSVADLSESLAFYDKLGFEKVDGGEKPYLWAVVSDGQLHLGLHQHLFSSPTLSYFALHGLSERMDHLPKLGVRLDNIQKLAPIQGMLNNELLHGLKFMSAEFASPEGQRVLLASISSDVETTPTGRTFFSKYEGIGELSLNTKDIDAARTYWENLGFGCIAEGDQPYPWIVISDGRIRLGLHQTPKLTKPTITYFAPDMPERLKRFRKRGIKFVAEHKDKKGRRVGAVIESPDGQQFFLFTGEIKPAKCKKITAIEANGFQMGQKVRIIGGPFEDFMGTVSEVDPDRARIKVQIAFFGQEKSIEFDFSQVERA